MSGGVRRTRLMRITAVVLRVLVAVVFASASFVKIAAPRPFAYAVYRYDLAPGLVINAVALILPWIELIAGVALLLGGRWRRGALLWMGTLLPVFTVAILVAMARGFDIACGCGIFGQHEMLIGWPKVIENTALFFAVCTLAVWEARCAAAGVRPPLTAGGRRGVAGET